MSKRASLVALLFALAACSTSGASPSRAEGPLAKAFQASATEAGVPRDLLVAIAKTEGGLALPAHRTVALDAAVPAAGPLMLRRGRFDTLAAGATLSGETELALRENTDLALAAGAKVLASLPHAQDLASYEAALEEMSGYADAAHRTGYAHRVLALLARGGSFPGRDGETITLEPHDLPPTLTTIVEPSLHPLTDSQFAGAEWIPTSCTNKCLTTRGGETIQYIVIHDTEGGWDASVSTLQNDPGKSVHYIVDTDGHIAQFVTEETEAYHSGNSIYNARSVGIEHVGYATQPFPTTQYVASAKLVDYLAKKYAVPLDRAHIIGHDQVPDGTRITKDGPPCTLSSQACTDSGDYGGANNHTDPGPLWEWAGYMARVGGVAKCDDVGSRWSCSHDGTEKFRCAANQVELAQCISACTRSDGGDDTCTVTPASVPIADASVTAEEPDPKSGCSTSPPRQKGAGEASFGWLAMAASVAYISRAVRARRKA